MEIRFQGNAKIFLIAFFGLLMVCSSYLIYFCNPLEFVISKLIYISKGSIIFKMWEYPPYEIYLNVYAFNITNEAAFIRGEEKLHFEEVGPYVFREYLTNEEAVFNDNGTLTFIPRRRVEFLRELSINDPKTTYINVPNVPLLGIASMLHQRSMFLNLAVLSISRALNAQPILNITVEDFFWGYDDKLVHMASQVLPNWISFQKFGVLDRMYDEGNNTVEIIVDPYRKKTGSQYISKEERGRLYSIVTWNGSPGLAHWNYQIPENNETVETNTPCNMLEGTYDGTVFPPYLTEDMVFRIYRKFACRPMAVKFVRKGYTEDNFEAFYYKFVENFLDNPEQNPENECYCKDKNFCLPQGLTDATPCYYGFPAAMSQPHLLGADPSVFEKIDGFDPTEEKHGTEVMLNPQAGVILGGHIRMQVNLMVWQTKYNSKTAPYNNMVLPLFWCDLRSDTVPSVIYYLLMAGFRIGPVVQTVIIYLFAIIGAALIASAGILVFLSLNTITQRSPSISMGYSPIPLQVVPVIRRESCLRDIRRWNK